MDLELKDKTILISGATSSIGQAISHAFAAEGAKLSLAARDKRKLDDLRNAIFQTYGVDVEIVSGDLSTVEGRSSWLETTIARFGTADVLVNCASATTPVALTTATQAALEAGLDLKLFGYILMTQLVVEKMKAQGSGTIVNVIGITGSQPTPNNLVGNIAGSALINLTKGMANELAPFNIRVVGVSPGAVDSDRRRATLEATAQSKGISIADAARDAASVIPLGRAARPAEIADAITFLASARAGYITGATLNVDGGIVRGV